MAPGDGRGPRRKRGGKRHAHKRRPGASSSTNGNGNGPKNNDGGVTNVVGVGADVNGKSRRRHRPRGNGKNKISGRGNGSKSNNVRRHNGPPANNHGGGGGLQPIKVSRSGIMSSWKKPLGGLIRYYVHTRTQNHYQEQVDQRTAEEEIDRMYYRSKCDMEDTKTMILEALGVTKDIQKDDWIDLSMAIEKDGQIMDDIPIITPEQNNADDSMMNDVSNTNNGGASSGYTKTRDDRGIILKKVLRVGEGPAHSHEQWTTIVVPAWAVGKSYFFQLKNNTPLNLSCELFLDGEKVARNSPLRADDISTIRPDSVRYFERHKWILNDAKRVKLQETVGDSAPNNESNGQHSFVTPRYNSLRPDYAGQRVSSEQYPDPTMFGWKFTGSVQKSRVEFFEKKINLGFVKMDFYYTTGTVKTVLHHPTSGKNQLFRAQVTPEQFMEVMKNPRAHTGQGYRRNEDRPTDSTVNEKKEDEFDRMPSVTNQAENEVEMEETPEVSASSTYFAKDDKYDFKRQGHQNRRDQMSKLQQSNGYAEWKEANKKEYAVIHAKFYVSIPKKMHRAPQMKGGGTNQRRGKQIEPLPVPQQAMVVDVKAAENATLGTKYEATGAPQKIGRSFVRMERINGLTDEKEWKGEPVFEKKLYYRAEKVVNGQGLGDESDIEMSEDETEEVFENVPLKEYKAEKISQVENYFTELSVYIPDPEEAEQRLRNVKNKIHLSESVTDVDDVVKLFHSDFIHRQIVSADH